MSAPDDTIAEALMAHLADYQSQDVAWPGQRYEPKTGHPYLAPFHLPGQPRRLGLGPNSTTQYNGIFQIVVVWPAGTEGSMKALRKAAEIVGHFKHATTMKRDGITVQIQQPSWAAPASVGEAWLNAPVSVPWLAFVPGEL